MKLFCRSFLPFLIVVLLTSSVFAGAYEGSYTFPFENLTFGNVMGYDVPTLPGWAVTTEVGAPQLPFTEINVAIPVDADVSGVFLVDSYSRVLDGEFDVLPCAAPRPISMSDDRTDPASIFRKAGVYSEDREYPGRILEFVASWDLAGQNFATVRFFPLRYNPVTGGIRVIEDVHFRVLWEEVEDRSARACNFTERGRAIFDGMLRGMALNPDDVAIPAYTENPHFTALPGGNYEHVIITTDSYVNSWDDLTQWHNKKGVPDTVVTTTWIYANYSGDNQAKIRSFCQDANQNWGTIWFLLGGDTSKIPYETKYYVGCSIPCDGYYVDWDNDWKYEAFIGRAVVDNTSEIDTFIDKVLTYEKSPPTTNFARTVLSLGFDFDSSTRTEYMHEDFDDWYYWGTYNNTKVYDSHGGDHRANSLNGLNAGPNLINHSDHCNYDVIGVGCIWHGWYLYNSDMVGLSNGDKLGNFYSVGCFSNAYNYNDAIGEEFVQSTGGGGTTYIGNSHYGWYNPGSTYTYSCFMDREYMESLFDLDYHYVGETLADSKNRNYPGDDYYKFLWCALNLNGEPELRHWMDDPVTMSAEYSALIPPGTQDFTVTVKRGGTPVMNALVCVRKLDDGIYEYGLTGTGGARTFTISPTDGTMEVTVTGEDLLPHEGTVIVSGDIPLSLTVTPDDTIIEKPGVLGFQVDIVNESGSSQTYQGWTELTLWNGQPYPGNPLLGPVWFTLGPGGAINRHFEHVINESVPSQTYTYTVKIGNYPGTILVEDSFEFEVQ